MGFRCDGCGPVEAGTKMVKKAVEERLVAYETTDHRGNLLRRRMGKEIAKEAKLCPTCTARYSSIPAIVAGPQKVITNRLPKEIKSAF